MALSVTTVGTFMSAADTRIVTIGLPTIGSQLGADVEQLVWLTQAYILSSTIFAMLVGRASDSIGRVRLYNLGFVVFTVGSALGSLSPSANVLIAYRVIQGLGAAMISSSSNAILTDATPRNELGTFLGLNQVAVNLGAITGFTLSGVLLTFADWRALFYINIPIGIFGTAWSFVRLKDISVRQKSQGIDWKGIVTFSVGLLLVLIGLTLFGYGPAYASLGAASSVAGVAFLVAFARIERGQASPILDLRLFSRRDFAMGNLALVAMAVGFFGSTTLMALYLQLGLRESPLQSGLAIVPLQVAYLITGPVSGRLSDRYGYKRITLAGSILMAAALLVVSTISGALTYFEVVAFTSLIGVAFGLFSAPNTASIMRSVPDDRRGVASGFRSTMFNIGNIASYSVIVLLITTQISFDSFTSLLKGFGARSTAPPLGDQFDSGFRLAAAGLGLASAIALVPVVARGLGKDVGEAGSDSQPSRRLSSGK